MLITRLKQLNKIYLLLIAVAAIFVISLSVNAIQWLKPVAYQGYIEGHFRYIAAPFGGRVIALQVSKGQRVKKGEPLFMLEAEPESSQLNAAKHEWLAAKTQINQAQAAFDLAKITLQRFRQLVKKGAAEKERLDRALEEFNRQQALLNEATERLSTAAARLETAKWAAKQKTVNALVDGIIFDRFYYVGEYAPAAYPIISMLAPRDVKAIFFIPEKHLSRLHLQQKVWIDCDGCKQKISATIRYISPQAEYTPPVIFSNDTRAKLVFRIQAYPDNAEDYPLNPGQPVTVYPRS